MLLGPVFHAELITTARRARYYVVRTIYGLIILFQIYLTYQSSLWWAGNQANLPISRMAEFGATLFQTFAVLQAVVVLFLTPALVGGTIADERQRKTLHYLLTSQLGGLEIVLGKLAARLLHVVVLIALGLPVVSLIGLFGGVDFGLMLMSYAGTLTMVYFLAGLAILVSVHSRRAREAISVLYAYVLAWLVVPLLLLYWMRFWPPPWPTIGDWIRPPLEWVAVTSPINLLSRTVNWGAGDLRELAAWTMGLQVLYGTIFVAIAGARLRAAAREEGPRRGVAGKVASFARKQSWFPRPECGDDAMLWKEKYIARTGGATKAVLAVLVVGLLGVLGYFLVDFARPALNEMWAQGYSSYGSGRRDFNGFLRFVGTAIYILGALAIASSAASGLTSEREEDTWISLVTTPLTGREILRAKMLGPIWAIRGLGFLLLALWAMGVALGSVHPLGMAACLIELAVFIWFLTALGTAFSLRAKNSTRALASTMFTLVVLNGGYLFCCIPFQPRTGAIIAGSTPAIFAVSLMSGQDLQELGKYSSGEVLAGSIVGVFGYAVAAAALTAWMIEAFDGAVDRPDRSRRDLTIHQRTEMLKGQSKEVGTSDDLI